LFQSTAITTTTATTGTMATATNANANATIMGFAQTVIGWLSDMDYSSDGNENYLVESGYTLLPPGYGVHHCLPASCLCVHPDDKRALVLAGKHNLPDEHDWRYFYDSDLVSGWMEMWNVDDDQHEHVSQATLDGRVTFIHASVPRTRCNFCLSKSDRADATATAATTTTAADTTADTTTTDNTAADCVCASCLYNKAIPPYCTCRLDGWLRALNDDGTELATSVHFVEEFDAHPRVAVRVKRLLKEALQELQSLLEEDDDSSHAECDEFIAWYLHEMDHYRQVGESGPYWVYIDWPELDETPEVNQALMRIEREKRRQVKSKLASTRAQLASTQAQLASAEKKIAALQAQLGAIAPSNVSATDKPAAGMATPQKRKAGEAGEAGEASRLRN
jgi:hypothetical protein